jgi:predicted NodU family carbamoyl transferase
MSQLILAIQNGPHDGSAAVLADYEVKAAVQLERLTRIKGDGGFPDLAIDEVLDIAGATRRDVDIVAVSRWDFPVQYFRHFRGWRWLREQYRTHVEGKKRASCRARRSARTLRKWRRFSTCRLFAATPVFATMPSSPSTIITRRTRCRHCSTPIGTTRCW